MRGTGDLIAGDEVLAVGFPSASVRPRRAASFRA